MVWERPCHVDEQSTRSSDESEGILSRRQDLYPSIHHAIASTFLKHILRYWHRYLEI